MIQEILILGIVHSAQSDKLLELRVDILKRKKFTKDFIELEIRKILRIREIMKELVLDFKPDFIAEESGPWIKYPGDVLLDITKEDTILKSIYQAKHFFSDGRILNGIKPSAPERELEIVKSVIFHAYGRVAIIVGASHLENIKNIFISRGYSVKSVDLKKMAGLS